ncbi:MAG: 6-bladed beta-propeller, partial [bacterium]|nr:6-bladed beta-propeller [bacterium]
MTTTPITAAEAADPNLPVLEFVKSMPCDTEENVYFKSAANIAVDKEGYLYAFDSNSHHFIYKMNRKGELARKIGRKGNGPGDLFRPFRMKVSENRIIIQDQPGIHVFDLDGNLKSRFRVFKGISALGVHNKKIYIIHENTKELFTVYDFEGKKIAAFGERYKLNPTLYQKG